MDWEVLIPILFFAIPVAASLLDKRAKKRKGIPPEDRNHPRSLKREGPGTESVEQVPALPEEAVQEGQRAIVREKKPEKKDDPQPKKLEIDKKKLILYSEILKPKFDA